MSVTVRRMSCTALVATLFTTTIALAQPAPATAPATTRPTEKPPTTAPSRITQVTVYQGTALVTREVDVPAGVGLIEVVVSPLPPQTIDSSLYTEGADGLRVLSTRYRTRAVKDDTRAEVRALQEQIKKLEADQQRIQKDIQVGEQNLQFLNKLEQFTAATMQTLTEKGLLNGESTITLSKYVMSGRGEISRHQVELQQQTQANQEAIAFANRQLGELSAGASRTERDAVIVVDKANLGAGKVSLNYLVSAATWRPRYKLRAGADKDPIQVEYLAAIEQQSGEDWTGAAMVLSTAQPMLNAAPPELLALDITINKRAGQAAANQAPNLTFGRANYDQSQKLRQEAQQQLNSNNSYAGGNIINEAAALEQTDELLNPSAMDFNRLQREGIPPGPREGPSVVYHLKSKLTIPSRNDEQLIEVARIELAPDYFYKAIPILTPHVYRLATLTNKSEYVLLPGEATMYVGKDFVGRMSLPLVAIGEQFTAGFGVDPQLQVTRTLVDKTRTLQGANQVYAYAYAYRLRVSSYKSTAVKLQLWDRLPKADAEAVGVTLVKTSPELSPDTAYQRDERPDNLLRWDLTIEPGTTGEKAKEVTYQFKLEYAKEVAIGNFKPQQRK